MEHDTAQRNRALERLHKLTSRSGESPNPFTNIVTDKTVVAIAGKRNGYLMIAPSREIERYADLPDALFSAARAWAETLETVLGAPRVYWITLSETTRHLHIHVFPRWSSDTLKGVPLFETRDQPGQPAWTPEVEAALRQWSERYAVALIHTGEPEG